MALWYCKAGFGHPVGGKCEHIVKMPVGTVVPKARPELRSPFPDDYYSEESLARRREENKLKYAPTRRPFNRNQTLAGNDAKDSIYS